MYDQIEVVLPYKFDNSELTVMAYFAVYDGPTIASYELHDSPHSFAILYENTNVTKLIKDLDSEFFTEIEKDCLEDAKKQCLKIYGTIYLP